MSNRTARRSGKAVGRKAGAGSDGLGSGEKVRPWTADAEQVQDFTTGPLDGALDSVDGENGHHSNGHTPALPYMSADSKSGIGPGLIGAAGLPIERTLAATPEEAARAHYKRRRSLLKAGLLLMVALLAAQTFYLSPFTDSVAALPPREPSTVPLAEVHPYGVNLFLHKEVDRWKRGKTLQMAQEMGAGWIKQQFPWAEIEYSQDPKNRFWDVKNNQNAWDKFDNIVALAEQYNLRVIARIDNAPAWARPPGSDPKAPPSPEHIDAFGAFIEEFVKHYKGRVAAIQVWNEPNLKAEWGNRQVNADEYVMLLKTANMSAKKVDPNVIILAAPLATNNEQLSYDGNLNELDYLQAMYNAGAKPYFDAMSANAYGTVFAPEDEPSLERLNFRRVELLRAKMEMNGDADKAVWFNEYGWNASPESIEPEKLRWGRVTPEEQADYTVRGIKYARERWPWAGVFTIWYLRQVGDIPSSESEYYFGLVNPDFVASPAYNRIGEATQQQEKVAAPGEWGPLSPPVQAGPSWQIQLSPAVPGGVAVTPSSLGDALDIAFTGTDVKVKLLPLAGSAPTAPGTSLIPARYYVTVDGKSESVASELPRDELGAYIDLRDGQATEVTLVRGLGAEFRTGLHQLQIRVAADPSAAGSNGAVVGKSRAPLVPRVALPAIGTIQVEVRRSYVLFGLLTFLLALGSIFVGWALWRSRPVPEATSRNR